MNRKYDTELIKLLCTVDEKSAMANILSDLLTPQEREELAVRLQIFKLLLAGTDQRSIAKKLGVSIATVTRGNREIKYGSNGISKVLEKMAN